MPRAPRRCGTPSGYTGGCRCDGCTAAKVRNQTVLRMRMMQGPLKVPALGVQRRINSLRAGGWPLDKIAAELGVGMGSMSSLLYKQRDTVTRTMYNRVAAVFDRLGATPGPSSETARRALAHGYAPPAAWDDDTIDDPAAKPDGVRDKDTATLDLDDWAYLVRCGEDPARAADRCGVTLSAVERMAHRYGRPELASIAGSARKRWSAA